MKEVTYEEWQKNPKPRMMWVWEDNVKDMVKRKVVYVIKGDSCRYPVRVTANDDTDYEAYRHCAEIEKQRRMTHQELAWWLREKPTREYKYKYCSLVSFDYSYIEEKADNSVNADILIREDGGKWHEPLAEVEE